ncbi:hypothetical protein ABT263_12255 [Kitasatospora sp. NPDC001603]
MRAAGAGRHGGTFGAAQCARAQDQREGERGDQGATSIGSMSFP